MDRLADILQWIISRFVKQREPPKYLTGKGKELTDERCNDTSIKATRKSR